MTLANAASSVNGAAYTAELNHNKTAATVQARRCCLRSGRVGIIARNGASAGLIKSSKNIPEQLIARRAIPRPLNIESRLRYSVTWPFIASLWPH
jgi:hypothetical protein